MQAVAQILSGFAEAIPMLSATRHPTLNTAVPVYNWLFDDLEGFLGEREDEAEGREKAALIDACGPENQRVIERALLAAHDKLRAYYSETWAGMYSIAIVLDPRLKMKYFEANQWEARLKAGARAAVLKAMRAYGVETPQSDSSDAEACVGRIQEGIFKRLNERQVQEASELDHYLLAPVAGPKVDVLKWWKQHASMYPRLARMARDYLAIPATSAPAERVFSGGADLITDKRGSLNERTIQACTCLYSWW